MPYALKYVVNTRVFSTTFSPQMNSLHGIKLPLVSDLFQKEYDHSLP